MSDDQIDGRRIVGYSRQVGERLRAIRKQKRLSLQEVEAQSEQEFKASVLGAYERGERAFRCPGSTGWHSSTGAGRAAAAARGDGPGGDRGHAGRRPQAGDRRREARAS